MENLFQSKNDLSLLTQPHANPCVSMYVPLARGGNSKGDMARIEQMLRLAQTMLTSEGLSRDEAAGIVQPMESMRQDGLRNLEGEKIVGLAFFGSPDVQKVYTASHVTPERVSVDNHFDLRPLVDLLPLEDEFFVLAITKEQVLIFKGSQSFFTPIFLPKGASTELNRYAVQGGFETNPEVSPTESLAETNLIGKFYSTVSEDRDYKFMEEYVRAVCHDVDQFLNDKQAPLIIAATEALKPVVEKYLKYPYVAKEQIRTPVAPDRSNAAELYVQAQKILERYHEEKKQLELTRYRNVAGTKVSASSAADILQAAAIGQIEVLLASSRRNLYGNFDRNTGGVEIHPERGPADTELVSLAVQEAINHDARVYLVNDAELPQDCPMVATLRW